MSEAVSLLGMDKVCFVCTDNKYDEITLSGVTDVFEYSINSEKKQFTISNETFGYPLITLKDIQGDSSKKNAEIIFSLFEKREKNAAFFVVAANAALALYSSGFSDKLGECKIAAEDSILSGKALDKLILLKEFGRSVQ